MPQEMLPGCAADCRRDRAIKRQNSRQPGLIRPVSGFRGSTSQMGESRMSLATRIIVTSRLTRRLKPIVS